MSKYNHLPDDCRAHYYGGQFATFGRAFAIGIALNLAYVGAGAFYGLRTRWRYSPTPPIIWAMCWASCSRGVPQRWAGNRPTQRHTYGFRSTPILAALVIWWL